MTMAGCLVMHILLSSSVSCYALNSMLTEPKRNGWNKTEIKQNSKLQCNLRYLVY